jgi:hypothetical protein
MLVLASTVSLGSESRWTDDHILLPHDMCLPRRCLAMTAFIHSIILAFSRPVTILMH